MKGQKLKIKYGITGPIMKLMVRLVFTMLTRKNEKRTQNPSFINQNIVIDTILDTQKYQREIVQGLKEKIRIKWLSKISPYL